MTIINFKIYRAALLCIFSFLMLENAQGQKRIKVREDRSFPFLSGVCPWILADFRSPFRMQAQYQEGWNRNG